MAANAAIHTRLSWRNSDRDHCLAVGRHLVTAAPLDSRPGETGISITCPVSWTDDGTKGPDSGGEADGCMYSFPTGGTRSVWLSTRSSTDLISWITQRLPASGN